MSCECARAGKQSGFLSTYPHRLIGARGLSLVCCGRCLLRSACDQGLQGDAEVSRAL